MFAATIVLKFRQPPHNIVVKYFDRRVVGGNESIYTVYIHRGVVRGSFPLFLGRGENNHFVATFHHLTNLLTLTLFSFFIWLRSKNYLVKEILFEKYVLTSSIKTACAWSQ